MKFKKYDQHQVLLLPPSLEELIGPTELVRVVDSVIDQLDRKLVESPFKGGGCPSYHPRMMLKVLVYSYCNGMYSCRKIARALRRDITFMWLAGMQTPDFNTVNRFRSVYLKDVLEQVFAHTVSFLLEQGYVRFEDYFLDGTKLVADASKYSYVWRKNTERFKQIVQKRAHEILTEVDQLNALEEEAYGGNDLPEYGQASDITSADVRQAAEAINQQLKTGLGGDDKKLKRHVKALDRASQKLEKYEQQQRDLGERNSCSKTDVDATFMRMKNDEVRAGYNLQAGAENGFVTGFSVSQNPNDARSFIPHMQRQQHVGLPQPERVICDAGYGTEENYHYLEQQHIDGYLKYPDWEKERGRSAKYRFHKSRFIYDKDSDCFRCPEGRLLHFVDEKPRKRESGYTVNKRNYVCDDCGDCRYKTECIKKGDQRWLVVSMRLLEYQKQIRKKLLSPDGEKLRRRRGWEIETVFGDLKHNRGLHRMQLRGLAKITAEIALHLIGYNLRRLYSLQKAPAFA